MINKKCIFKKVTMLIFLFNTILTYQVHAGFFKDNKADHLETKLKLIAADLVSDDLIKKTKAVQKLKNFRRELLMPLLPEIVKFLAIDTQLDIMMSDSFGVSPIKKGSTSPAKEAMRILLYIGSGAEDDLLNILKGENQTARKNASAVLREINSPRALQYLLDLFANEENREVKINIIHSLTKQPRTQLFYKTLALALCDDLQIVRDAGNKVVEILKEDKKISEQLTNIILTDDSACPTFLKMDAVSALVRLQGKTAKTQLFYWAADHKDDWVRMKSIEMIPEIADSKDEALRMLEQIHPYTIDDRVVFSKLVTTIGGLDTNQAILSLLDFAFLEKDIGRKLYYIEKLSTIGFVISSSEPTNPIMTSMVDGYLKILEQSTDDEIHVKIFSALALTFSRKPSDDHNAKQVADKIIKLLRDENSEKNRKYNERLKAVCDFLLKDGGCC